MPLTLRLIFHSIHGIWAAAMITVVGWVTLVPATPAERAALGAQVGVERPDGLVQMRIARAMIHVAPERAARVLSKATGGDLSPELAAMLLRDIAAGPTARQANNEALGLTPHASERSGADGAKFVQIDP